MKKFMTILAALVVIGTLGACGSDDDTVVVLTSSGYEPYEMIDTSGNLTGFDIELMEALAEEIGITIEWQDVNFDGIIASLQAGTAEIAIAGISPTAERDLTVDFSDVYYNSEAGLLNFIIGESLNITSLEDLDGLTVGAQLGTIQADLISDLADEYNFTVSLLATNALIVEEIKAGRVDALVVENIIANSIIEDNASFTKDEFDYSTDAISGNAIAFTEGSEYVAEFNAALQVLTENGTLADLIAKWFE
jgi:polar amino acid transport system substrate-binding protein